MLKIWGRKNSINVQKALWAIEETKIPYQHIDAGGDAGGLEDAAYFAMNPNGRVPTIDDSGFVLWESQAIVRYISAVHGETILWFNDPRRRAIADQWMDWTLSTLYPDFIDLFWRKVRTPLEDQKPERIKTLNNSLSRNFKILDSRLAETPFVGGHSFSMADIPAGTTTYRYFEMPIERPSLPHVEAWHDRLQQRPAYRRAIIIPFDDLYGRLAY